MRSLRNVIIVLISIALVGFAVNVFAHGGGMMGRGNGWGDNSQGYHHRGGYGHGPMWGDQLSEEEVKQLEQARQKFFNDTKDLRDNLYTKERELRDELAKDEPDTAKASKLQKEISGLEAQFDQKRINHMVELKKLNPNIGRGYGRGHMMNGGPMMGYGPREGGYCW
jgi:zinc resistance-associated protein